MAANGSISDISIEVKSNAGGIPSPEEGVVFSVAPPTHDLAGRRVSTTWLWEID
jgi:hypothetical protein